jgi:prepilin-type N-terminal cleavage/methylation domain-containing protein
MNASCRNLLRTVKNRDGFTLIEMLIVIIILGILAMVIIPQISVSTDDAKVSTLKTNLAGMRSAIELYSAQHNVTYPGVNDSSGAATTDATISATAFVAQLTQYTDATGAVVATKDATHTFGPYVKGGSLPSNPFRTTTVTNDVVCDTAQGAITAATGAARTATGTSAWMFLPKLGIIFANDESSATTVDTPHKKY